MRRMYSESELRQFIRSHKDDVAAALVGKDISVEEITSKGIANTGGFANTGDVTISGDLNVQGEGKGIITCNAVLQQPRYEFNFDLPNETGLTKEQWYTKVIIIGNELHIIGNAKYTNSTENSIQERLAAFNITIPSEIGQFIYDMAGKTLNENPLSGKATVRIGVVCNFGDVVNVHSLSIAHINPNTLRIYENESSTIPANGSLNKGFHITLILTE